MRFLRSPQSRCTVTTASATFTNVFGAAEAHDLGDARIGVGLAMGHAHAAADRHVPAGDVAGLVRDGDVAEVVREDIDVVRGRHRHHDLEFARQVGLAVDRLHHLVLAARDALAVEPDLAIGRRMRQQVVGDRARQRRAPPHARATAPAARCT